MAEPVKKELAHLAILEAVLFASEKPLTLTDLQKILPINAEIETLLERIKEKTRTSGFQLVEVAGGWRFQTDEVFSSVLKSYRTETRKLSQPALETLSIIAYHQPVTRAEIEFVRGVSVSKGTLDRLMEIGWVRISGRRRVPGRPMTYAITPLFLEYFGLKDLSDLPDRAELKAMGLLDLQVNQDLELPASGEEAEEKHEALNETDPEAGHETDEFHTDYHQQDETSA